MRKIVIPTAFLIFLVLPALLVQGCSSTSTAPTQPNENVTIPAPVAEWDFNGDSATVVYDSSVYHNNGIAVGTTIVPGKIGNARQFNGNGDYVIVPDPINGAFDFGQNQSFTIDLWFKTTSDSLEDIIRKGSAPVPGYFIQVDSGFVDAGVGAEANSAPPDSVVKIYSTFRSNDGKWHEVRFIRDRETRKLYLYIDGVQAAKPVSENFPELVTSTEALTIGRWTNAQFPLYFKGTIDQVTMWGEAVFPQ